MRHVAKAALVAAIVLLPALASAQSLAGVVRDGSGAILPGVTVEAASPALIEKVRSVVSDGSGQYRLEGLAPGTYSVTYTLPGFNTVKREDVQVTTGVTVTLNIDLRVGGVEETITVTGETPVVDVQNSTRVQRVMSDETVAALPASRGYGNLLATVSGIQSNGTANSGTNPDMIFFTSRGGRSNEGTVQIDGMNVGSAFNGGGVAGYGYDTSGAQEVQVTVAGGLGEPTAAARRSTWCRRPAATRSRAPSSATSPASGRRATTSTTSSGPSASRRRPRSSAAGTPASRWAARSCVTACGSTRRRARSATTPTSPAASAT
jgi:hypothetical protein